jgi:hypothetical protein
MSLLQIADNALEAIGDTSPSSYSCALETGSASMLYYLDSVTDVSVLQEVNEEVLGTINLDPATNLQRDVPLLHPWLPMYSTGIASAQGMGGDMQIVSNVISPFISQPSRYVLPSFWKFNINFQLRPYPIYDDVVVDTPVEDTWVRDNGTTQDITYYPEYERFVQIQRQPAPDSVASQTGQLAFNATGLPDNSKPLNAMPRLYLNNAHIKMVWHCIPYRYYTSTNSYLQSFVGRVNQTPFVTNALGTFQSGSLLYLGCTPKPYRSPTQGVDFIQLVGLQDAWEMYMNVELDFLWTRRPLGETPSTTPTNDNYVVANHNLLPYLGQAGDPLSGSFLYASTCKTQDAGSIPLWKSCPLNLLFNDPDSPDAISLA